MARAAGGLAPLLAIVRVCAAVAAFVSALLAFGTAFPLGFIFIAVFTTFIAAFTTFIPFTAFAIAFIGVCARDEEDEEDAFPRPELREGELSGGELFRKATEGPPDGSEAWRPPLDP